MNTAQIIGLAILGVVFSAVYLYGVFNMYLMSKDYIEKHGGYTVGNVVEHLFFGIILSLTVIVPWIVGGLFGQAWISEQPWFRRIADYKLR